MGEADREVGKRLQEMGFPAARWNRRALGGTVATPWPGGGPYAGVLLRLPRAKEEVGMALAAAASVLDAGGRLVLFGAKDEGIGSVDSLMEERFREVAVMGVGGRCRLLGGFRRESLPEKGGRLLDWRATGPMEVGGEVAEWVSYPGVFAHGRLDPGTRLLLSALPRVSPGERVLDYGCGSGVVGAAVGCRAPGAELHLLDVDAVALEAARENVPGGRVILRDGLARSEESGGYRAIVSNPPFHRGKDEDPEMVRTLIREAPAHLTGEGTLTLVAQKRLALGEVMKAAFGSVTLKAQDRGFRVWEGQDPRGGGFPAAR